MNATVDDIVMYADEFLGAKPKYIFSAHPMWSVLRHPHQGKWFAVLAKVRRSALSADSAGHDSDEVIDIVVVKSEPPLIDALVEQPGFARGYHMNKEHWVTVLLDGSANTDDALDLLHASYELTKR
ncbi:MmcQ/YjbR family DNA-binding protein [Corynebacterium sp. H78]|uniref:MmcQ/YjbR family DNA-binding protein n=1 Tax=Corynebacterium sp. H78 TaxID=3133417 RepID=UPI0030984C7A